MIVGKIVTPSQHCEAPHIFNPKLHNLSHIYMLATIETTLRYNPISLPNKKMDLGFRVYGYLVLYGDLYRYFAWSVLYGYLILLITSSFRFLNFKIKELLRINPHPRFFWWVIILRPMVISQNWFSDLMRTGVMRLKP